MVNYTKEFPTSCTGVAWVWKTVLLLSWETTVISTELMHTCISPIKTDVFVLRLWAYASQAYLGSVSRGFDPSSSSHKTLWGVFLFVSLGIEPAYAVLSKEPCNMVGHKPNVEHGSSFQEVLYKVWRRKYCVTFPSRPHIRCYFVKNTLSCLADWNMVIRCWTWSFSGFGKPWPKPWNNTGNGFRTIGEMGGGRRHMRSS